MFRISPPRKIPSCWLLLPLLAAGCNVTKSRLATEQLVIADAVDHAVSQLDRIVSMENIKVDSVQTQRTTQAPTGRATVPVVALRVEVDATTFRRPAPAAAPPGPRPAAPGGR